MNYTYTQKENIGNKLMKLNNKSHMEKIIKMIKQSGDNSCLTENISQGHTYIKINNLSDSSCALIDEFLKTVDNNPESDSISTSFSHYSDIDNNFIKLSTKEKSLITREKYKK